MGQRATVKLSGGSTVVSLTGGTQIGDTVTYKGGPAEDGVSTDGAQIGEDSNLNLASGNPTATFMHVQLGDDLIVKAGAGDDTIQVLTGTGVGDQTVFKTGGGTDVLP